MAQVDWLAGRARVYAGLVSAGGLLLATLTVTQPAGPPEHLLQFCACLLMGVVASRLKMAVPGIHGTLSVSFLFVLLSAVELPRAETLIIACTAALAQCILAAKARPRAAQVAFHIGNAAVCAVLCDAIYHSTRLRHLGADMPVLLVCASGSYFLVNTLLVSGIVGLTEKRPVLQVWLRTFLWTGPQYLFGAGLVGLIHLCDTRFGWQYSVFTFPGIYLLDRTYRVYLRSLREEKEHARDHDEASARLAEAHRQLIAMARQAGMAEMATGVLHNVKNVLNSVNVSATIVATRVNESPIARLSTVAGLLEQNSDHLADYLRDDPRGRMIVPYLSRVALHLGQERNLVLNELQLLTAHIEHLKAIVETQQDCARVSGRMESVSLAALVEDAIRIVQPALDCRAIRVERVHEDVPAVTIDKHGVLQILINLLRNAVDAIDDGGKPDKVIEVRIRRHSADRVRVEVADNGIGLLPETLSRIFAYGFTTKSGGHGFGLHSGVISAKRFGGSLWAESQGHGQGATFVLDLPLAARTQATADTAHAQFTVCPAN